MSDLGYIERAKAIRLPLAELARRAGVHEFTVARLDDPERRRGPVARSVHKIRAALEAEEARVFAHLRTTRPDLVAEGREAA